jgi:hypothetical protein
MKQDFHGVNMALNPARVPSGPGPVVWKNQRYRLARAATLHCKKLSLERQRSVATPLRRRSLAVAGMVAAALAATVANDALAETVGALVEPQTQIQAPAKPFKPMTPERVAWLKKRCAQLVAYYDYYGVGRGENSDGPRNHTRIGAAIDCERSHYRAGIDAIAALLVHKCFEVPKPGTPAVEPEDTEAPDIINPTRRQFSLF